MTQQKTNKFNNKNKIQMDKIGREKTELSYHLLLFLLNIIYVKANLTLFLGT